MAGPETKRYDRQRQEAIRAAAAVFAEKGFHGASTADIAHELGIKQGSLYYYFRSKEDALSEVCMYGLREYAEHMADIAASHETFQEKVLATVMSHLSSYRERNEALKVYNDERLYLPEEKRAKLKELGSRYRERLEELIESARKEGVVRESVDPHFGALAIIGLCNSLGDLIVRDQDLDLFDIIRKSSDLLMNGFLK